MGLTQHEGFCFLPLQGIEMTLGVVTEPSYTWWELAMQLFRLHEFPVEWDRGIVMTALSGSEEAAMLDSSGE